jgi:SWI/SNF-related matrix-associated actin-dependent regulator of chromatin subfamily A-like protein 1
MLYPYQLAGARWLASRDGTTKHVGLLGDGMGLGKSAQAVGAADYLSAGPVTVICPAIMVGEWRETLYRFGDVPRYVHAVGDAGPVPQRGGALVASYERAQRPDVAERIRRRGGVIVFDESHYLKDPTSGRTARLLSGDLTANAERVVCLTGTPIPNHAGELYPIMARAGLATGDYGDWLGRYCITRLTDHGFAVVGHRNVDELRSLLRVVMLRRMHQVALPPTAYDEWEIDPRECRSSEVRMAVDGATAARLSRLIDAGKEPREVATLRRLVGIAKAGPIARRVAGILDGDPTAKVVVFALHTDVTAILARELHSYGVVTLTGETPERQRKARVDTFQTDPRQRVALCQVKAAGVGVTLTAGNHLVLAERTWSPADEDQALHRIIRIGQTRPTFVHTATLAGSIDRAVNRVLLRKRRLIAEII